MKKVKVTLLALAYVMVFFTDTQAQTTERQDAVGKFRIVPAVMLTFNPYSVDDGRNNSMYAERVRFIHEGRKSMEDGK